MVKENEISQILNGIFAIEKKAHSASSADDVIRSIFRTKDKKGVPIPAYYPSYPEMVRYAEKVRIHYDMNVKPGEMLIKRAPNQDQESYDYTLNNYRPITFPYWNKAESTWGVIWNKSNYSVKWNDQGDSKYKNFPADQYFEKDIPLDSSIFSYFESIVTKWKDRDPNAVLAHKPHKIKYKSDTNKQLKVDTTELINPIPVLYKSNQVLHLDDSYCLVELNEKTIVTDGANNKVRQGRVFEIYDNTQIYRIEQYGKQNDNTYNTFLYWKHNLGYVPVKRLKGIPEEYNGDIIYRSHFNAALPNLDEALVNNSTLQMSIYTQAFPHMWMIADDCTNTGCIDGYVHDKDKGERVQCSVCNGSGKRPSPTGVFQVRLPGKLDAGQPAPPTPPFGFESPDIGILDFLKMHVKDLIIDAFAFLNIDVSNSNVKGSETALSKMIDREERYSFTINYSNELFDLLEFSIKVCGQMRYGTSFVQPDISRPVNFTLRTYDELTEEIGNAYEKKLPSEAIKRLLEDYLSLRFNTNTEFLKLMKVLMSIDKLIGKTEERMIIELNRGIITNTDLVLHNNGLKYLKKLTKEDHAFLDKDKEDIEAKLIEMATEDAPSPATPKTTEEILQEV